MVRKRQYNFGTDSNSRAMRIVSILAGHNMVNILKDNIGKTVNSSANKKMKKP